MIERVRPLYDRHQRETSQHFAYTPQILSQV